MKTFENIFGEGNVNYSYNNRANFSKISGQLPLPNLCEIQTASFEWLKTKGIDEVLKDFFPIANADNTMELQYDSLYFEQPKNSYFECKSFALTYSAPLHVVLRLKNGDGTIKEGTIFMGDFPMMTDSGTFVINGVEKVVESQIVRSSGAYMHKEEQTSSATFTYGADIIPARGTWLEFLSDAKGMLYVRIDKQKKVPVMTLLRALGIVHDADIYRLFGTSNQMLKRTMEKYPEPSKMTDEAISIAALKDIYAKLRPGEPIADADVARQIKTRFFVHRNYDLGPAGRYKINKKLGIYDRLLNHYVAEDLVSAEGEVVLAKGQLVSKEVLDNLKAEKFFEKGAHQIEFPINLGLDDHCKVNVLDIYADADM